jgi:hypothetical protein
MDDILEEAMNGKNTSVLCAVLLIVFASISCKWPGPATEVPMLKIDPDSLLDAQTGVAYEAEIRVSQNVTPVGDIYISSGALPAGLTLSHERGEVRAAITGSPTNSGTFTFTIRVDCLGTMRNGQDGEKEYVLVVK